MMAVREVSELVRLKKNLPFVREGWRWARNIRVNVVEPGDTVLACLSEWDEETRSSTRWYPGPFWHLVERQGIANQWRIVNRTLRGEVTIPAGALLLNGSYGPTIKGQRTRGLHLYGSAETLALAFVELWEAGKIWDPEQMPVEVQVELDRLLERRGQ